MVPDDEKLRFVYLVHVIEFPQECAYGKLEIRLATFFKELELMRR